MALAAASIIFNATKLDFSNLFKGDSQIAVISILASLCVLILLAILQVSLKIKDKHEKR
ncbi:hypothetical protein JCM19314_3083 [Nonlabens ulvanivorans]|nr:hypothetical protein JCM19296_756 [Nonlabens ulvanivorans]GAK99052.1 hypothetical protein JCM19314_3083 [Nonlabens ulvanivorans]